MIIRGKIQKGKGVGKKLGFPTLNLAYEGEISGVFAGRVRIGKEVYKAAVHVGEKPTFADKDKTAEAYLLDFEGEIDKDEEIEIEVLDKIRETEVFESLEGLKKQIVKDVELVKGFSY